MESFPKNKTQLETSWLDKISSGGSFLLLVLVFALVIFNFKTLPDIIPVHFNFLGEADRFSGKESIWLLPALATAVWMMFTFVDKKPQNFNYLVKITAENKARQYSLAIKMLKYLKLALMIIFSLITWQTILVAKGELLGLETWVIFSIFFLTLFPLVVYSILSFRRW